MEARYALLLLLMYTISGCFASSFLKKWRLRPHGGHVADKSNSSSPLALISRSNSLSLANGNPTEKKPRILVEPTRAASISEEEKRKQRMRKKRKQLKKELRSYKKALNEESRDLRKCRGAHQCERNECCIKFGKIGFCRKRPQKGHRCKPRLKPGLEECSCQTGLTCSHYKTNKYGYKKYRCERLRFREDEKDQA